jgi:hypothetical protein
MGGGLDVRWFDIVGYTLISGWKRHGIALR